jgi:hypothetical protein
VGWLAITKYLDGDPNIRHHRQRAAPIQRYQDQFHGTSPRMMLALVATQRILKIHHALFGVAFRSELLTWT